MKAICGIIQLDGQAANPRELAAMRAALTGRGVAEEQAWHAETVALAGVTWWPVADGVSDPTLYFHPESGCAIVADALLFERAELLAALDLPPSRLRDIGEPELILHAYLRWGDECAVRLYGDFAFVIHDPRNARVYTARDGMGVRPMYFHHVPGKLFAFASNVSAVTALPQVPRDLNEARIADYLLDVEGNNPTSTFFTSVRRLLAAHWCGIDRHGYRETCYWMPGDDPVAALPVGDEAWTDAVRAELQRAVRQQMAGRDGFGSMVSGGLDSSTVAAMAADLRMADGSGPLPVFSAIDSANPACAETRAIRSMLASPRFAPHVADIADIDSMCEALMRHIPDAEEPFDGGTELLHTQYALAANAGVGAVMDGIDADVLFGEGERMLRLVRSGHWLQARKEIKAMLPLYGVTSEWKELSQVFQNALTPRSIKDLTRPARQRLQLRTSIRDTLIAARFAHLAFTRSPPVAGHVGAGQKALVREQSGLLRGTATAGGLERYRRVASMYGMEPRHPFLDRRLIALCIHLPDRQRARDGWTKSVLRHAAQPSLPADVCWRRGKEHLGYRFSKALFDHPQTTSLESLWKNRSVLGPYLDFDKLASVIERYRHRGGVGEDGDLVFDARHLQIWLLRQQKACRALPDSA